jgi:probable rRNA maturation factor
VAIEVVNRQRFARIDSSGMSTLVERALAALGRPEASLTVAFVRDRAIRKLNQKYRNQNRATDVLSFPASQAVGGEKSDSESTDSDFLGDIVVSTDTARIQAFEAGHTFEREIDELVLHGVLHLCGYDHEADRGEMNRIELKLRRKLLNRD